MVLIGTLRKWNPRPACGTAVSSVRISISVCFIGIHLFIYLLIELYQARSLPFHPAYVHPHECADEAFAREFGSP